eukprot:TRINITY_DN12986_c0_g1_i3.p1 TRINITY_DN12986_c0_g1~~TRINITY_DN12986_c0_g1_i3.p1  ORF type:complete len:331 (+),score=28.38 TRINITY_DN12986_c0_g1_i3:27-1019(+)
MHDHRGHHGNNRNPVACSTPMEIHKLQRRFLRLRGLLRSLQWPKISHFTVAGVLYKLPLPAISVIEKPSGKELEYLSGFFDGDGCVYHGSPQQRCCSLSVTQSLSGAEILLRFRHAFGGGIYHGGRGMGLRRPTICWKIQGSLAQQAASFLGGLPSQKQAQLLMAKHWPSTLKEREKERPFLQRLKQTDPDPAQLHCTWRYLAGFFDAEGCISARPDGHINLIVVQKFKPVLEVTQQFLIDELPCLTAAIHLNGNGHELSVSNTKSSILVLRRLVEHGLTLKRSQAYLALSLSTTNYPDVREQLSRLKGNQCRYSRLDSCSSQLCAAPSC